MVPAPEIDGSEGGRPDETRPMKALSAGSRVSHYRIIGKIGQGGMGVVYKAEDTKLKRTVALKFLPPYLTEDPHARERFVHEAQAASALDHHNICTIYEIDETEDGHTFISMSCYEGKTLREKMEKGPLELDEVLSIGHQISEGLTKAHGKSIVHRDLKPANIMITDDGVAKIMDFGLAKLAGRTKITRTGTTMGTPAYMSPEQAQGKEVDERSDIFSLGVILYEMLTGRQPFKGEYEAAVLHSILYEDPEPLSASRPGLPVRLQEIVGRMLAKEAGKRYENSTEVASDLAEVREETRSGVVGRPRRSRIGKRYLIPLIAILGIAGAYIIFSLVPHGGGDEPGGPGDSGQPPEVVQEDLFTIVVAPFWGATDEAIEEGKVMQGLIERQLRDELGGEADVQILGDAVTRIPRSEEDARALGKELDATLVIWGEVFSLHGEVEIQPRLTRVRYYYAPLDPSASALEANLSEPSQLAMRKAKAEEVGNLVLLAAAVYYRSEDSDRALAILRRIKPRSAISLVAEAWVEFEGDRRAEAESLCFEAVSLDSLDPNPYYALGTFYSWLGRYKQAIPGLERAFALDPEQEEFRWQLAQTYVLSGEGDKGLELWRELVDRKPESSRPRARLGMLYSRLNRQEEAIGEYKVAIRLEPDNPWWYSSLASAYVNSDSLPKAVEMAAKARDLARSNYDRAEIGWYLGFLYQKQERYENAIGEYLRAIALMPDRTLYYYHVITAYDKTGKREDGLSIVQDAVEAHPEDAEFHRILGDGYRKIDRPADAVAAYKEALRLDPNNGDIWNSLGVAYSDLDSFDLAASCFRAARDLGVRYWEDFGPTISVGRAYLAQGMYEEAETEIGKALETIPEESRWHANLLTELGVAYTYQDEYDKAAAVLEKAAEADLEAYPEYVYFHIFYGLSLHRVGRADDGRAYLRDLADSYEGDPWQESVLGFLTGTVGEDSLLLRAPSDAPESDRQQKCETYYYIGLAYLLDTDAILRSSHPDTAKAQAYFEKCVDTGVWQFLEYFSARGELGHLNRE